MIPRRKEEEQKKNRKKPGKCDGRRASVKKVGLITKGNNKTDNKGNIIIILIMIMVMVIIIIVKLKR